MVNIDLSGKVALITGGSRGLGKSMAKGLAGAGATVLVASRKLEACEAVCEEIRAVGMKSAIQDVTEQLILRVKSFQARS